MIEAKAYSFFYLLLVSIYSIMLYVKYSRKQETNVFVYKDEPIGKLPIFMAFLILFIGLRPESYVFVDMMNYIETYHAFYENTQFVWDWTTENFIFDNIFAYIGSRNLGTSFFFVIIAAIYFGCAYWGIRRLFPRDTAIAYLTFLSAFSTFSYATNGIKAGAAASLFILALSYYRKWIICVPLLIITLGFHHSMIMPIAAFVLTMLVKNPKQFFWGWLFCLICAVAHVSFFLQLFAGLADEKAASYLNSTNTDWGGKSGFRIDFVLYSAMPVLVGYYAIYKHKIKSKVYDLLLKIYLTTNGIWMLCMYAEFTNRIAYLSWSIYPLVLIFPILEIGWGNRHYKTVANVFFAHLAFTLFMEILYY